MADEIRYLPPDCFHNIRIALGDDVLDTLGEDGVWKLERLLESVFATGYEAAYTRGYQSGHDAARARQKRNDSAATAIDTAAEVTP